MEAWFACGVLAVITHLDGANVLLFHVEQSPIGAWEYRVGEDGEAVEVKGEMAMFAVPHYDRPVDVWWRQDGGEWHSGVAMEFGDAEADFLVAVDGEMDVAAHGGVRVSGLVRGQPSVWHLDLPPWKLGADGPEVFKVRGFSLCRGMGQVLRREGEFRFQGSGVRVMNRGESQVALREVVPAVAKAMPFQPVFMIRESRLSDDEIEKLKKEVV